MQFSIFNFQCCILFLLLASSTFAQDATLSLPLQGHYRPGRYMPVRISAHSGTPTTSFTLRATGALTTDIQSSTNSIDALIPWLSIRTIRDVHWSIGATDHPVELPLHPLGEDDRLIGYVAADPDALAPLFEGKALIRIPLDPTDPLPGEITAWESLDGVVFDAASAMRIKGWQIRDLLASGVAVAIRTAHKPGGDWPWKRQGIFWVARADIAGPTSAYVSEAYGPTQTWAHGWPFAVRKRAILAAAVFVILAIGVALWQSRWAVILFVAMCALGTSLGFVWRHRQSVVIEATGSIIARTDSTTQRDRWTYRAVLRDAHDEFQWEPLTRMVVAYRQQADEFSARLICGATGQPLRFTYELKPLQSLAFQMRVLNAGREDIHPALPIASPMRLVADSLYTRAGDRIIGQVHEEQQQGWADIVIERTPSQ